MRILILFALFAGLLAGEDKPVQPVQPVQPTETPKLFTPTPMEAMSSDNLRLEYENFQLKVQLNKLMLDSKRQAYIDSTLKAHGSPKDVVYDNDLFIWRMVTPEKPKEAAKESAKESDKEAPKKESSKTK